MDKILSSTLIVTTVLISNISQAALITASFDLNIVYKYVNNLEPNSDFEGITHSGVLAFNPQLLSSEVIYRVPNEVYSVASFVFGNLQFSLPAELQSEFGSYTDTGATQFTINPANSHFTWDKYNDSPGLTRNRIYFGGQEIKVNYLDNDRVEYYSRGATVLLPFFYETETLEEAVSQPSNSDFISLFTESDDPFAYFRAGASHYNCGYDTDQEFSFQNIEFSSCTAADVILYQGTISITEVTIIPVPAGAWLFGSALAAVVSLRLKREK